MRNLKRALSLALAMVMVLSMMVIGAGAASYDDFSDKDEIVNKEAVQMLVELGVINGKDDGSYDPTGIVTRAEMAKMICVVLNGGKDPSLGNVTNYSYADTVGHWAAGYIEYCTQLGIVAGDGAGNFNPNATVTGSEAAKMLLVAMGYKSEVEGFTGANWAVATNVLANKNGLYDGLAINVDAGLTRDNAAQMMYNALDANTIEYDYDIIPSGDSVSAIATAKENEETLLTEKFGVKKVEAIVVANEYATLSDDAENALDEGKTKIEIVSKDDGGNGLGADGTYDVSTPVDMLGKQVTMFIKYKNANALSDKDAVVYGNPIVSSKNNIVTATDGSYVENHGTTKGLLSKNDLSVDYSKVTVLKNYEEQTIVAGSERINDTLNQIQGGTLTLIDNDNDDEVEYVIYNEYTAGVVTNYSTSGDGSIKVTGIDKYDDAADVVGFDDVAKGDFVLAIEYGGKLYVEVPETVTGELGSFSTSKAKGVLGVVGDHGVLVREDDGAQHVGVGGGGFLLHVEEDLAAQLVQAGGDGEVHGGGVVVLLAVVALVVKVGDHDAGALVVEVVGAAQVGVLVGHHDALHLHGVEAVLQEGDLIAVVVDLVLQRGAGGQAGVLVGIEGVGVLHHVGVQSVVDHLGGVVAAQAGVHTDVQVVIQALLVGPDIHAHGPVGAGEALDLGLVAQSHQQHLGGLGAGHGAVGVKGAVALAGHDAQLGAVLDVAGSPVAHGVGVAVGDGGAQAGVLAAVQHDADHLGHLGTGHDAGGIVSTVILAVDDAQLDEHLNGLFVDDLVLIGEVVIARSAGADDHHGQNHDHGQSQAESPLEVSHLEFLLLKFGVLG